MKNIKNSLLTFAVLASLFALSCKKDQALINTIEGSYTIEKVVYMTSKGDSTVSSPNSTMFFDDCNLRKTEGPQQCKGSYKVDGVDVIEFDYRPEEFGGQEQMVINIGNSRLKPFFGGAYLIEDRTQNSLTLLRFVLNQSGDKEYNLRLFLKK